MMRRVDGGEIAVVLVGILKSCEKISVCRPRREGRKRKQKADLPKGHGADEP